MESGQDDRWALCLLTSTTTSQAYVINRRITMDELIIDHLYATMPDWSDESPDELDVWLQDLKNKLADLSVESQIKYLRVLQEFYRLNRRRFSQQDIEFIITRLASTIHNWESNQLNDIEILLEDIDLYEGSLPDEIERKYYDIRDDITYLKEVYGLL